MIFFKRAEMEVEEMNRHKSAHLAAYVDRIGQGKRKTRCAHLFRAILIFQFLVLFVPRIAADPVFFLSTQLTPLNEADKMRQVILKDFQGEVDFQPYDDREVFNRLAVDSTRDAKRPCLIGGLHGHFVALHRMGTLDQVDNVRTRLAGREFIASFLKLGKIGQDHYYFIPWMQATYLMTANRSALKYLPKAADLDSLTYEQLKEWAANMFEATGEAKLGFPAGEKGLMHRFLQGYLYPSYTGSTVRKFRSPEAEEMWQSFRELWRYVNPRCLTFNRMDQSLLTGEVWVAWDHTARLIEAFEQRPDDFVAFPVPSGPKGRGFMVVLAGLGLPKDTPHAAAVDLIEYLTRPEVQITTLESVGFFPVVQTGDTGKLPAGLEKIKQAVSKQASSRDAVPSMLPVGLGEKGKDFNLAYKGAFSRIVLRGRDIRSVLETQAEKLRKIVTETQAQCWPPDEPSVGPCPVE